MRDHYDFSKGTRNKHAKRLKAKPLTFQLDHKEVMRIADAVIEWAALWEHEDAFLRGTIDKKPDIKAMIRTHKSLRRIGEMLHTLRHGSKP